MNQTLANFVRTSIAIATGALLFVHCSRVDGTTLQPSLSGEPIDTSASLPFDPRDPNARFTATMLVVNGSGAHPPATVTYDGMTYRSDADGLLVIPNVPIHLANGLRLTSPGFMPRTVRLSYAIAGSQPLRLVLEAPGATVSFGAAAGGAIATGPIGIFFPAGGYVDANGDPYTGVVNIAALGVDPLESVLAFGPNGATYRPGFDPGRLPQGLDVALNKAGERMLVLPESFFQVEMTGANGAPLRFAAGTRAQFRFRLSAITSLAAGDVVPTYRLNETTVQLEENGSCTVQPPVAGRLECVGSTDHFSSWAITTSDNTTKPACGKLKTRFIYSAKYGPSVQLGDLTKTTALVISDVKGVYAGVAATPPYLSADKSCFVALKPLARATVSINAYRIENGTIVEDRLTYDVDRDRANAQLKSGMPLSVGGTLPQTNEAVTSELERSCFACPETLLDIDLAQATLVSSAVVPAPPPPPRTCEPVCNADQDCIPVTFVCNPKVSCTNGLKDGEESDVDCGRSCDTRCGTDKACTVDKDCSAGNACDESTKRCKVNASMVMQPTCVDGIKNGDETDADCGGSCSTKCANGQVCTVPNDCASANCDALVCQVAACTNLLTLQPNPIALPPDDVAVQLGDFNGDTFVDAVVIGRLTRVASILLGRGDGTFQNPTSVATGVNPLGVAVGDVNGDGDLDLVTTSTSPATVNVHLGNGDGTFQARVSYATGDGPNDVVLADLDEDGKLDIITANFAADSISVLLGNGNGTFNAKVDTAVGQGPGAVAVIKLRGAAAKPDVIVMNVTANSVGVLLGTGALGALAPMVAYATDLTPTDLAVGDVNGDGTPDVVVSTSTNAVNPSVISVLLGNAIGTLQAKTSLATGRFPNGVALADLDQDGNVDIVAACSGDSTIAVHRGGAGGVFLPVQTFSNGMDTAPITLAVANLKAAGKPDVFVVTGTDTANVLLGCGP